MKDFVQKEKRDSSFHEFEFDLTVKSLFLTWSAVQLVWEWFSFFLEFQYYRLMFTLSL